MRSTSICDWLYQSRTRRTALGDLDLRLLAEADP
jgi:hypothetical protein